MKAQKKPVVIDYYNYTEEDYPNDSNLKAWVESFGQKFHENFSYNDGLDLKVNTLEGTSYIVTPTDMIIRGVNGEYYPCKKDIFEKTYDKI